MIGTIVGIAAKDCKAGEALTVNLNGQFEPIDIGVTVKVLAGKEFGKPIFDEMPPEKDYEKFLENMRMQIVSACKIPRNKLFGVPEHYNCRCYSVPISGYYTISGKVFNHKGEEMVNKKELMKMNKKHLVEEVLIQHDKQNQFLSENERLKSALKVCEYEKREALNEGLRLTVYSKKLKELLRAQANITADLIGVL